jgi:[ribosomal protein S5]-alanine N-acetyltransferase
LNEEINMTKAERYSIQTERLIIRSLCAEDWPALHAYMSNPEVVAWLPEGLLNEAQAQEFAARNDPVLAVSRGVAPDMASPEALAVVLRESGAVPGAMIGHMVFHPWFAPATYEIGWVFHPAHQRRGYATEAARALLRHSFEVMRLHRIVATCQPENPASWRVMEKLGMRREGWFRQCIYRGDGLWWDEYFYALLDSEWPGVARV